eukprot:2659236-Rhodomonas_salina.1
MTDYKNRILCATSTRGCYGKSRALHPLIHVTVTDSSCSLPVAPQSRAASLQGTIVLVVHWPRQLDVTVRYNRRGPVTMYCSVCSVTVGYHGRASAGALAEPTGRLHCHRDSVTASGTSSLEVAELSLALRLMIDRANASDSAGVGCGPGLRLGRAQAPTAEPQAELIINGSRITYY